MQAVVMRASLGRGTILAVEMMIPVGHGAVMHMLISNRQWRQVCGVMQSVAEVTN